MLIVLLVVTTAVSAQYQKKKAIGARFNLESGAKTEQVITVESKSFDIYKSPKGSLYVKAVSSKGKSYPVWIGSPTEDMFEGKTVYVTKNRSYCIYELTKSGYPYPVYLTRS